MWSCTSTQRIFLPGKIMSPGSVRGGTQFLQFGQKVCEMTRTTGAALKLPKKYEPSIIVAIISAPVHVKVYPKVAFCCGSTESGPCFSGRRGPEGCRIR